MYKRLNGKGLKQDRSEMDINYSTMEKKKAGRNGVGIIVSQKRKDNILAVNRVSDRLMSMQLVIKKGRLSVISAYMLIQHSTFLVYISTRWLCRPREVLILGRA